MYFSICGLTSKHFVQRQIIKKYTLNLQSGAYHPYHGECFPTFHHSQPLQELSPFFQYPSPRFDGVQSLQQREHIPSFGRTNFRKIFLIPHAPLLHFARLLQILGLSNQMNLSDFHHSRHRFGCALHRISRQKNVGDQPLDFKVANPKTNLVMKLKAAFRNTSTTVDLQNVQSPVILMSVVKRQTERIKSVLFLFCTLSLRDFSCL